MATDYEKWEAEAFEAAVDHLRGLALYADNQRFTADQAEYESDDDVLLLEIGENGTSYVHGIGGILPVPNTHEPYREGENFDDA